MASGENKGIIQKENISDLVTCPLCLEYFKTPKLLPCGHSVCRDCLRIYIDKTLNKGTILCPMCRSSLTLPNDGVDGLTHSFFIVRLQDEYNKVPVNRSCESCNQGGYISPAQSKCVECCEYLCQECAGAHKKFTISRNHHITTLGGDVSADEREKTFLTSSIKCHHQKDELVCYFCLPCQQSICRDCKALDHTDHKAVTFHEAIKGKRDGLKSDLSPLERKRSKFAAAVDKISENISTFEREKKCLIDSIDKERRNCMDLINRAADLDKAINHAETVISGELKIQKIELERAQFLQVQLESHTSYTNILLSNGSDVEVLHDYNLVKGRSTNLTSDSVSVPGYQIPRLQSTLDSLITDDLEKHFTLSCGEDSLTELRNSSDKTVSKMNTGRRLESLKLLQTMPNPSGKVITGVALHLDKVFVCADRKLYGFGGNTWSDVSKNYNIQGRAWDVRVNHDTVVVSMGGDRQRVQLTVNDITTTGNSTVTLPFTSDYPHVVCDRPIDGQPSYLMTEETEDVHVVHHIDSKGNILQTYGRGELRDTRGLAVDVHGDVVVADWNLDDVIIFSQDGSVKRRLRRHNNLGKDRLSSPCGVCVDHDGYIFVPSYYTHSVVLFSPTGDYIRTILTQKDGISNPSWITVSQHGHLAVRSGPYPYKINVYTRVDYA